MIEGVVQRIEFGERVFDAWVQTPTVAGVPGALFQVRSEYRFPRADIEKLLAGKAIYVAGWRAKSPPDSRCVSSCGFYATDIRLANGEIITPAGEKLMSPPAAIPAPRGSRACFKLYGATPANADMSCSDDNQGSPLVDINTFERNAKYDMGAPVTIEGRIIRADNTGCWVELVGFEPANTPGAQVGKQWFIEGGYSDKGNEVGRRITASGYNAKDTSCNPTCRMYALLHIHEIGDVHADTRACSRALRLLLPSASAQTPQAGPLDDAARAEVVGKAAESLRTRYIFPEAGETAAGRSRRSWRLAPTRISMPAPLLRR